MLFFSEISLAAASAPVRAARKTGLLELFAITAIVNFFGSLPACTAAAVEPVCFAPPPSLPPPHAIAKAPTEARTATLRTICIVILVSVLRRSSRGGPRRLAAAAPRQAPRGNTQAPSVHHHRDDDGAADHDPLVVLVEVQRADRLANQHDQDCPEHGAHGASLTADQARAPHDRGG